MQKYKDVDGNIIKLKLFPFSLRGRAKDWLLSLPRNSIDSWDKYKDAFIGKYYPPAKIIALCREFRDIVIEARKVFERFNMLGSRVEVVGTTKEDIKVPIPCKLVGLHEALEKNFDWICPENPFNESSEP
jgi:hypothetical protein